MKIKKKLMVATMFMLPLGAQASSIIEGGAHGGGGVVDISPKGTYQKVCTVKYFIRRELPKLGRTCDLSAEGNSLMVLNAKSPSIDIKNIPLTDIEIGQWNARADGLQENVEARECLAEKIFYTFRDNLQTFAITALRNQEDGREDLLQIRLKKSGREFVQSSSASSKSIMLELRDTLEKDTSISVSLSCVDKK